MIVWLCFRCSQVLAPGQLAPWCLGGRYRCDTSMAVRHVLAPPAPAPAPGPMPVTPFPQVAPGAAPSAPSPHPPAPPDLDRLGRDALRDLCRAAGVSTKGTPDDLRHRLRTSAPRELAR